MTFQDLKNSEKIITAINNIISVDMRYNGVQPCNPSSVIYELNSGMWKLCFQYDCICVKTDINAERDTYCKLKTGIRPEAEFFSKRYSFCNEILYVDPDYDFLISPFCRQISKEDVEDLTFGIFDDMRQLNYPLRT